MAPGDLNSSDPQRFLVDPELDLVPDATFRATMLAGVPFSFALHLDTGAVDQRVQRTLGATIRDIGGKCLLAAR